MTSVAVIHFVEHIANEFEPASPLKASISMPLKSGVQRFSSTEEFEGVPIAHPVLDHDLRLIALITRDIGQADAIVGCSRRGNGYLDP